MSSGLSEAEDRVSKEPRIRVDDGVVEGGEVSMFYDPMIAKLISWAPTREGAIDAQVAALDSFQIDGVSDNVDFLSALMQHPRFRVGRDNDRLHRRGISRRLPRRPRRRGFGRRPGGDRGFGRGDARNPRRADRRAVGRANLSRRRHVVRVSGDEFAVAVEPYDGGLLVSVDGEEEIDLIADYVPGQRLIIARFGRATADRPGRVASAAAGR